MSVASADRVAVSARDALRAVQSLRRGEVLPPDLGTRLRDVLAWKVSSGVDKHITRTKDDEVKVRQLRKVLTGFGCVEVRQSGSHLIVRCKACQTVVPVHTADIPPGTLRSIEKMLAPCLGKDWLKQGGPP